MSSASSGYRASDGAAYARVHGTSIVLTLRPRLYESHPEDCGQRNCGQRNCEQRVLPATISAISVLERRHTHASPQRTSRQRSSSPHMHPQSGDLRTHSGRHELAPRYHFVSATTEFRNTPIREMSTSTTSPGLSHRDGWRAMPTPGGVPVEITSPGSRRVNTDT
jgi:hypothetical protein